MCFSSKSCRLLLSTCMSAFKCDDPMNYYMLHPSMFIKTLKGAFVTLFYGNDRIDIK